MSTTEQKTATAAPDANTRFDTLPLSPAMLENLTQLGYLAMTPIQAAILPTALAGKDLIAQAKTVIKQCFYEVTRHPRLTTVAQLLNHVRPISTLAFCNTKQQCKDLVTYLQEQGFNALALYGELEQRERDQVLAPTADAGYTREQIGKIKLLGHCDTHGKLQSNVAADRKLSHF